MNDRERPPRRSTHHVTAIGANAAAVAVNFGVVSTGPNAHINSWILPPQAWGRPDEVNVAPGTHNLTTPRPLVGRTTELARLHRSLTNGPARGDVHVIHGLGGVGKSALALHYARAHTAEGRFAWWIRAHDEETVESDLAALTYRVNPALAQARMTPRHAAEWARNWLQSNRDWLLVFDDVADPGLIEDSVGPLTTGRHLITSRRASGWAVAASIHFLDVLAPEPARELLRRCSPDGSDDVIAELAADLGHLPLAVEQAAAYLEETRTPVARYLARLRATPDRMLRAGAHDTDPQDTVAGVWRITEEAVAARSPFAARLAHLLAWYAPLPIPREVVYTVADDQAEVDEALGVLAAYNMVRLTATHVEMHRLVQVVGRMPDDGERHGPDVLTDAHASAVRALAMALPASSTLYNLPNLRQWPWWLSVLPHIDHLVGTSVPVGARVDVARLLLAAEKFRSLRATSNHAAERVQQAVTLLAAELGADHVEVLAARLNLGWAYEAAGGLGRAEDVYTALVSDHERVLGPRHEATLTARLMLQTVHLRLDKTDNSNDLAVDCERFLGPEHELTVFARYHHMTSTITADGVSAAALDEARRNTHDLVTLLGEDNPLSYFTRASFGVLQAIAGDPAGGIGLLEEVIDDCRRACGRDDEPWLAFLRGLLAMALFFQKEWHRARELLDEVLPRLLSAYSVTDPDVLLLRYLHCMAMFAADDLERTHAAATELLDDTVGVFPRDHFVVMWSRLLLALCELGEFHVRQARELASEVHADMERVFGSHDENTAAARKVLRMANALCAIRHPIRWLTGRL